jgi:dUTPase
VPANAPQATPSGSQAAQRAQDVAEAAQRASAAPAQAGSALRHPTQVRVITTRSDLAAQPTQINSHTVSIPWNPDPTRGDDVEVNVPPDAQRSLRTGLAFHVAPGYEAIITCAGSEPGHRQPVAWLQGKAKEELVIRFRNSGQQTRTFLAGQELGQLTLRKLEALDMAFSDPHAAQADTDAE